MADTVTTSAVTTTKREYVVHLTNISDGTGESNVIKVDKSTFVSAAGIEPVSADIEQVRWAIQGMTYVKLRWNHTSSDTALVLSANGYDDYRGSDGALREFLRTGGLLDPRSSGGTGDIELTTVGAVSGGTYDITLWVHLAAS